MKPADVNTGADKLIDLRPPTKLPRGLSCVDAAPAATAVVSTIEHSDQSPESSGSRQTPENSPEGKAFEVPIASKTKKLVKVRAKVQPKPKAKPKPKPKPKPRPKTMTAVKKTVPVKRGADELDDEDTEQYVELDDVEDERENIEAEKKDITLRQFKRQREEDMDARRMAELNTRGRTLDQEESRLLEGKSAG